MDGCYHEKEFKYDCANCKKIYCLDCLSVNLDNNGLYICNNCYDPSYWQRILKFFYII